MLLPAPLAFGDVAGKQYDNRMQVWTGEPSHPMIWMISACGAEDARPGRHALTKLFRKVAKDASSTPSICKPFQVKPTVTHLASSRLDPTTLAVPTLSMRPVSHARPSEPVLN